MKKLPYQLKLAYHTAATNDTWGNCQAWRFALADYLTHRGLPVPSEWHFRQSPLGPDKSASEWRELAYRNDSPGTLARFARVLGRLSDILKGGGHDY